MDTTTAPRQATEPPASAGAGPTRTRRQGYWLLLAAAVLTPVVVALLLTPWRHRLAAADDALILVVAIVAVATAGYRWAAALSALVAALAFDFFLTRPYNSFRITRTSDLVTELLLLVVGLTVGDPGRPGTDTAGRRRAGDGANRSCPALGHRVAASWPSPGRSSSGGARELTELLGSAVVPCSPAETRPRSGGPPGP